MKTAVFWYAVPCSLADLTDFPEVLTASIMRTLMDVASTSETLVDTYNIKRRKIPVDSHLQTTVSSHAVPNS
jgi:hypothetical protein